MSTEFDVPLSGLSSRGSGDSAGGMLELLSITDAAVKALNKSTHSTGSHGSQRSLASQPQGGGLEQALNSDRSERSARSGLSHASSQSLGSQASGPGDGGSARSHVSEVSVRSHPSVGSAGSVHSERSMHSHQSARSGQSVQSQHSARSALSQRSSLSQASKGSLKISQLQTVQDISQDSGMNSKSHTATVNEKSKARGATLPSSATDDGVHERSSDESTTASDILIRSTLDKSTLDKSEVAQSVKAKHAASTGSAGSNGPASSGSSKCSRTSYGAENFNSSGPQKVKISKKHLREIKPPFDDVSPRLASNDGKVPPELLSTGPQANGIANANGRNTKGKEEVISSNDSNGEKTIAARKPLPQPLVTNEKDPLKIDKFRKSAEKPYEDVNISKSKSSTYSTNFDQKSKSSTASSGSGKQPSGFQSKPQGSKSCDSDPTDIHFRSTPKYRVERHTPQKPAGNGDSKQKEGIKHLPEKKNLLQDLEDSIEIITAHARDESSSSSQPEIVTVQERIVTVSARNSASPSSVMSDPPAVTMTTKPVETLHSATHRRRDDWNSEEKRNLDDSSSMIPPALPGHHTTDGDENNSADKPGSEDCSKPMHARFQWFSKQATGKGLRQGGMVDGPGAPDSADEVDIQISDFKMTSREKLAKEAFAKSMPSFGPEAIRQGGPVRRVVQARLVGHDSKASSTSSAGELKPRQPDLGQSNDQILTCAAAASAAVAATQPFLKTQQDLETKMAEVLAKLAEVQSGKSTTSAGGSECERVRQLERQLAKMTDRRIEYVERLQEQQLAMQAKLLGMSREQGPSHRPYHPRSYSPESNTAVPNKAFSKTTVARQPSKGDYSRHTLLDPDDSSSPLDTPAPRARAPRPTINNSDIEIIISRGRSPKARSKSPKSRSPKPRSSSKSRSPKPRSRSPVKDRGILHQILDSDLSPPRGNAQPTRPNMQQRMVDDCESPNVRKARGLIEDLSQIKHDVRGLVEEKENWKAPSRDSNKLESSVLSHDGPYPLDSYLRMPDQGPTTPYKSVPDLHASQINAPLLPGFKDAEAILRQVQQNRGMLESNFEAVMRARHEAEVYSMLGAVYNDSTDHEKARIKKMVDKNIQKLRREVEREITDDLVISEIKKKSATTVPGAVKMPEPTPAPKAGPKYGLRARLAGAQQAPVKVEPKVETKKVGVAGKRPVIGGPPSHVTQRLSRPPTKKTKSVFEDEEMMTRIYGKANYQRGRTTVKDPYLHYQNTAKHKHQRPAPAVDVRAGKEMMSSKTQTNGARGPSSGVSGGMKQFYFNPATGQYIPVASSTVPIHGQLIPMAVPLGEPRMDSGLTATSAQQPGHVTFDPVSMVTAQGNVTMVTMGMTDDSKRGHKPELAKQVLPAVDIDTDLSQLTESIEDEPMPELVPTTPERKPKKHVQIVSPKGSPGKTPAKSPGMANYEMTVQQGSNVEGLPGMDQRDTEKVSSNGSSDTASQYAVSHTLHTTHTYNSDDTLPEEEDDVETAPGLEFPGHQPQEVEEPVYNGPAFPPKLPSAERQMTSELIAEDIRRRDLLQNNAMEWLEQELMARIITEMYPLQEDEQPPADISHVVSEASEDSMAEEKEKSMFVMDTIGHRGMQLFVDTGVPVDNSLVNRLVTEVMQDKIRTMLGERPGQEAGPDVPRTRAGTDSPQWEEPVSEAFSEPTPRPTQVQTPEPTPRASPKSSPVRGGHMAPAITPPASPPQASPRRRPGREPEISPPGSPAMQAPVQPVMVPASMPQFVMEPDSEPESSASYDIREELDRLADKLRPTVDVTHSIQSRHDVATPPESPKPLLPEITQPLTPPDLSPRPVFEEPFMMSQSVMPAGTSLDRTQSRPTKSGSPKSATSPQVTDLAEEELAEDQPKPVVFTVAGTQTDRVATPPQRSRSPSPGKPRSRTPSESSYTESSSISESFNECVSEGQWLINKSDGEIADFPIDDVAVRNRLLRQSQKRVDVSSASTWKDADDVDLDEMNENSRSEGEFVYQRTQLPPERDPVLDMLARLQTAAGTQYGLYNMSNRQVTEVLNTTGRSEGEVLRQSVNQQQYGQSRHDPRYDTRYDSQYDRQYERRSQGEFYPDRNGNSPGRHYDDRRSGSGARSPKRSKSPKMSKSGRTRSPHREDYGSAVRDGSPRRGSPHKRAQSPSYGRSSPTRVSFEGDPFNDRPSSPTRGILKRSSTFDNPTRRSQEEVPVRDTAGRSSTPTGRLTPGGRAPQVAKGMMMAGERTSKGIKPGRRPPQVNKSSAGPDLRGSGPRIVNVRTSGEERDSLDASGPRYYGSDYGTRTMTPDQMNTEALIQSGYLSQSFSQSEQPGRQTGQSSLRSSTELRASRMSGTGQSLGYSYGSEGSLTMSELQRLAGSGGKVQMSLTLPTGQQESDISEFDITDGK